MKLSIDKLGFVEHIDLDLGKKLTVFSGPNNTGKTYITYAIYGFMKYLSELDLDIFKNKVATLSESGKVEIDLLNDIILLPQFLDLVNTNFKRELSNIFATTTSLFEETNVSISNFDDEATRKLIINSEDKFNISIGYNLLITVSKAKDSSILECFIVNNNQNFQNEQEKVAFNQVLRRIFSKHIFDYLLKVIIPNCYITPVERIAINIFSKELSIKRNTLVDKLLELNSNNTSEKTFFVEILKNAKRYPLPIRDSLEISEDLNTLKKEKSQFFELAEEIEKDILHGVIGVSKDGEVQFKPNMRKSLKLPINLSASVVKSLSNLVLYFKHIAKKGDYIIIDEPELNLHPDNQVIIARVLVRIINSGFKLLISTHSDIIIRELNNLIMLHSKREKISKYNLSEEYILNPDDVEVFLFHLKKRKVEKIEVTEEGFEIETMDEVINRLENMSQDLYFGMDTESD